MTDQVRPATRERLRDLRHIGQEMGLCNVVLSHPDTWLDCLDVRVEHFSEPLFRLLWGKLQEANDAREQGTPPPTLASILHERDPELVRLADEHYGGFPALRRDFIELQCRAEHVHQFRERVMSMAFQRELVAGTAELAAKVSDLASATEPKIGAMQDAIESKVADLFQRTTAGADRSGDLLCEKDPDVWIAEEQERVRTQGEIASFETGMPMFDVFEMLQPGRVTCWLIEYKGGKSTIAVNMAARLGLGFRLASRQDVDEYRAQQVGQVIEWHGEDGLPLWNRAKKVDYIDLEMGKERDVQPRTLSLISGVPIRLITSRRYLRKEEDVVRVRAAYDYIRKAGIHFSHPEKTYDLRWLRNVVRESYYRRGTQVLILDYLRPPPGMDKNESHVFEAALADTLKALTEEFNLVTITFAQLNRMGVQAKKQRFGFTRPTSSDIQGNIKVCNFVDTMLVQDDHADDPKIKRWWVDVSRITEKTYDSFMRVEPFWSQAYLEVTGIEDLVQRDERPRRGGNKPKAEQPAAEPTPPAEPAEPEPAQTISYGDDQLPLYGGYEHDEVPF